MKARRAINDFLNDIRSAAIKAQQFVGGMDIDTFASDEKTAFAVVRGLEIIGEATQRIPQDIRQKHSAIPWRSMAAICNKLIHDYISVDLEVVWRTAHDDLPELIINIERVIQDPNA